MIHIPQLRLMRIFVVCWSNIMQLLYALLSNRNIDADQTQQLVLMATNAGRLHHPVDAT